MSQKKGKDPFATLEEATAEIAGQPEDAFQITHKYGTYNIQPTADSDNEFPEIAQGLPKAKKDKELEPEIRK